MSKREFLLVGSELRFLESQYTTLIKRQYSCFVIFKQYSSISPIGWKLSNILLIDEKKSTVASGEGAKSKQKSYK